MNHSLRAAYLEQSAGSGLSYKMIKNLVPRALFLCIAIGTLVSCGKGYTGSDNLAEINLSSLLITPQEMPPGLSQYGSPGPSSDDRTPDSMTVAFLLFPSADSGIAQNYGVIQTVYRFKSTGEAEANYKDLAPVYFGEIPSKWDFQSKYSDSSDISCYTYTNDPYPSCVWTGRYHTIVIKVAANLYPDLLTLSDLENIVSKIDAKIGKVIMGQ